MGTPTTAHGDLSAETHWETAAKTKMGKYLTKVETDFISKSIDLSKQKLTIMDVGAEAGRFSLLAANNKATVVSVDLDSYSLRRLKLKTNQVNVIQADARNLPLRGEVFDAVFMVEVLDYIPNVEVAFIEAKRTLKPNASCILSFGNRASIKAKIKAMQGKPYRHSYKEIMQSLSRTGFIVKGRKGYSWLLFGRTSESPLVRIFAALEKYLGLRKVVRFSPWVIVHISKPA